MCVVRHIPRYVYFLCFLGKTGDMISSYAQLDNLLIGQSFHQGWSMHIAGGRLAQRARLALSKRVQFALAVNGNGKI